MHFIQGDFSIEKIRGIIFLWQFFERKQERKFFWFREFSIRTFVFFPTTDYFHRFVHALFRPLNDQSNCFRGEDEI